MQRSLSSLLSVFLVLGVVVLSAAAQTENVLLIGGNYRLRGTLHNMQDGYFGAPPIGDADDLQRFVDTRLRLFFDVRPHPLISVNYKMEIGDITFGANDPPILDANGFRLENVGQGTGGEPGADGVNVETKNAYLDVQIPWIPGLSFRGGIIGWGDQFDWTILATDFTGLQVTYQRQALWAQFTYLKFAEGSLRTNDDDSDWYAVDTRLGLSARTALAASVYVWDDNSNENPSGRDAYQIYTGLKLNTVLFQKGLFEIFGVYNVGQEYLGQAPRRDPNARAGGLAGSDNQGFMVNMNFDYPLGKHWLGLTLQYISGEPGSRGGANGLDGSGKDVQAFLGLFNSQYSGFGVSRFTGGGGLELITLGQLNDTNTGLNNVSVSPFFGGSYNGRILAVLRAKIQATPVLFLHFAAGLDQAAHSNVNGDAFRGIEVSSYLHWDIFPKLWLRVGGAYMFTGPWWDNNPDVALQGFPNPAGLQSEGSADNIFHFMVRLQYDFG
jgi:hypothetical protein